MSLKAPLLDQSSQRSSAVVVDSNTPQDGVKLEFQSAALESKPSSAFAQFLESEKLVHCLCFCLGMSALLPWFSFITSAGYFRSRFCGTNVETTFLSYFAIAYNFSNAATQALLLRHYHRLVHLLRVRIYGSMLLILALCLLTAVFVLLPTFDSMSLFYVSLVSVGVCGVLSACYTGGIFAVLGTLPGTVTQTFVAGQGLAGFGVSVVSLVTISLGSRDDSFCTDDEEEGEDECSESINYSALAFFCTSCIVVVLAIVSYSILETLPITKRCRENAHEDRMNSVTYVNTSPVTSDFISEVALEYEEAVALEGASEAIDDDKSDQPHLNLELVDNNTPIAAPSKYARVYEQIKMPAWSVFFTFTITLSLFPAVTVLITSHNECESGASRFSNDLFIPFVYCLFNSCDFAGRILARRLNGVVSQKNMLSCTFMRIAFYPLILLCDIEGTVLPVVFNHDAFPIVIVCAFGLTNGTLVALAMKAGPAAVAPRHASLAATCMLFSLTSGLCCGACLSFVSLYISQGSFT